jgi:2EXR family
MTPPAPIPTTFPLFAALPTELRQKIFLHATTVPRTLSLTYDSTTKTFHTLTPPPILLSTTHSSRLSALQQYTLSFGTSTSPPRIYFNAHFDTLYVPRHQEMGYDSTLRDFRSIVSGSSYLLDQVRSVAVDHVRGDIKRPWEAYNKASFIRSFPNLEEIIIILGDEESDDIGVNEEVEFVEPKGDPERLLMVWYYFRQSFLQEERLLEEVCRESGAEYKSFDLPVVRIRRKVRKGEGGGSQGGIVKLGDALEGMRL